MSEQPSWPDLTVAGRVVRYDGRVIDLTAARVRLVGGHTGGQDPFQLRLVVDGAQIPLTDPAYGLLRPATHLAHLATALRETGDPEHATIAARLVALADRGVLDLLEQVEPDLDDRPLHQESPLDAVRAVSLADAAVGLTIAGAVVIRPRLVVVTAEHTLQVELVHPVTGSVRPAEDLLALAALVEAADTSGARRAAAQIRQVAGWPRLAARYQLTIDVGSGPVPAQPAARARPAVAIGTPRDARRHAVRLLLLIPLSILVCLTSFNVGALSRGEQSGAQIRRTGTALVTGCTTQGPVSTRGFGMWTTCTVEVSWDDGTTQTRTAERNFFAADEVGSRIDVGEIRVGCRSGCEDVLVREERPVNGGYFAAFLGLFVLAVLLALLALDSRRALRYRRHRRGLATAVPVGAAGPPPEPGRPAPDPGPGPAGGRVVRLHRIDEVSRAAPGYARAALAAELDPDEGTLTFPAEHPIHLATAGVRLTGRVDPGSLIHLDLTVDRQRIALFDPYDGVLRDEAELTALAAALRGAAIPHLRPVAELLASLADRGVVAVLPPGERDGAPAGERVDDSHAGESVAARRRHRAMILFGAARIYLALALAAVGGWHMVLLTGSAGPNVAVQPLLVTAVASVGTVLLLRGGVRRIRRLLRPPRISGEVAVDHTGRRLALRDCPSHLAVTGGARRRLGWSGPWPVLPVLVVEPPVGPVLRVPLADPATGALPPAAEVARLAELVPSGSTARHLRELARWRRLAVLSRPTVVDRRS